MAMAMAMEMAMVMVVAIVRSLPHGPTDALPHRRTGHRWGPLHVIGLISSWNWAAHFWAWMRLAS